MTKKILYNCMSVLVAGSMLASCENTLDVDNTSTLSDAAIWSTLEAADGYITASYKIFTDDVQLKGCRSHFWDSFSDLTKSSSWDQYGHPYNAFLIQGLNTGVNGAGPFECWSSQYVRIRTANVCLSRLREYGSKFGKEEVAKREAEIRLCRAYSFFMLARVYGGVILRTEKSSSHGGISDGKYPEDIAMARATEAETYQYILDELQFAADNLPDKNDNTWLRGRATKAFAYGLISRIALFAKQYDVAAKAAEECAKCPNVALDESFDNICSVNAATSPETLFAIEYLKGNTNLFHLWDSSVSPAGDGAINGAGAYGEHQPTAELADLYEWSDGTPFSWNNWSASHNDPFSDREPRFQATILYNGAKWRNDRTIETFEGGVDGFVEFKHSGSTGGHTCTGYFLRKFLQIDNTKFLESQDKSFSPDLVMRYAEVLLNQAEAYTMSDLVGNQTKILDCINAVRSRVNLPDITINDINSEENAMTIIRNERAKELAGEGLRFWDLRRWGLARSKLSGVQMHGVKIKQADDGSFSYERVEIDGGERVYPEAYNYFSIPLSERSNNPLCTNNTGW